MKYKKSELRNSNLALLRRVQRQIDNKNEKVIKEENGFNKKFVSSKSSFNLEGFKIIEPAKKLKKKTRLNLLDRRNMF